MGRDDFHLDARHVWTRAIQDLSGVPPDYVDQVRAMDAEMDHVFTVLATEEPRLAALLRSEEMFGYFRASQNASGAMLHKDLNFGLDWPAVQLRLGKMSFRLAAYVGWRSALELREGIDLNDQHL